MLTKLLVFVRRITLLRFAFGRVAKGVHLREDLGYVLT